MEKKYLGIDIGGTFIKLGIVDDTGNVSIAGLIPCKYDCLTQRISLCIMKTKKSIGDDDNKTVSIK